MRIVLAELGHEAGMVGAALVGFETLDATNRAARGLRDHLYDVTPPEFLTSSRGADVVGCEEARHTRGLLARHGIQARLLGYHHHNAGQASG